MSSRSMIYVAMVLLLFVILVGATQNTPPVLLAVALVGEIVLVSTAHLSCVIERHGIPREPERP